MENSINKLYLKDYLTYLPAVLIFTGLLRIIIFYKYFHVNIIDYLAISEVLLTLFDTTILVLAILTATIISITFLPIQFFGEFFELAYEEVANPKNIKDIKLEALKLKGTLDETTKKIVNFLRKTANWLSLFTFLSFIIYYLTKENISYIFFYLFFILTILAWMLKNFVKGLGGNFYKKKFRKIKTISLYILLISVVVLMPTIKDAQEVKFRKKYFGTEIKLDKELLVNDSSKIFSDSNNTYIGQTKDFVFLYSIRKNTSTVIPRSKVLSTVFKCN